ncbi:MAG: hypothetical protein IBX68_06135 [Dehalococcoidia bacterium]|nr:hypothetical protein [Dehalococcoidia bacterium]
MVRDILSGIVTGLAMSTVFLGIIIYAFISTRNLYDRLAARLPASLSPMAFMVLVLVTIPVVWGILGALIGFLYAEIREALPGEGLGSPNAAYTLIILGVVATLMLLVLIVRRRNAIISLTTCLLFAGIFGWILPLLAEWR